MESSGRVNFPCSFSLLFVATPFLEKEIMFILKERNNFQYPKLEGVVKHYENSFKKENFSEIL
ncbi:hypothetical protein BTA37_09585 [Priestia megaterium]|jgi:hypothetical protein|nr:hypothetical protein BTA37_09585 [Priestia megaterium]